MALLTAVTTLTPITNTWGNAVVANGNFDTVDTFANRPAFGNNGRKFYATDKSTLYLDDGSGWVVMAEPIQTGGGFTGISGGTQTIVSNYWRSNGTCYVEAKMTFVVVPTTWTGAAYTLPITANSIPSGSMHISFTDAGTAQYMGINDFATTSMSFYNLNVAGTYPVTSGLSTTTPFTWGAGDSLQIVGSYRMATRYS